MRPALLLLLGACSFHLPEAPVGGGSDAAGSDMMAIDMPPPRDDGCTSFSTQVDTCGMQFTTAVTIMTSKIYDTDTHVLADFPTLANPVTLDAMQQADLPTKAGTINAWLVTTLDVSGPATLRVVGSKPFGIVASAKVTLDGLIDASSDANTTASPLRGAGSLEAAACNTQTPSPPDTHSGGAGGGGGGAYQGAGGHGGDGDSNEGGSTGGPGGVAIAAPRGPRGGCPGSRGGHTASTQLTGGAGGNGGGAIYLVSQTLIEAHAMGRISVGGGGAEGGRNIDGGGGGGGSGGMILLEGPQVKVDGTLAANGGGGGGGAGGVTAGGAGGSGQPSLTPAPGGTAPANATRGESGSAGATLAGTDNAAPRLAAAGGGGGGGAGYISVVSGNPKLGGATITPALTPLPP